MHVAWLRATAARGVPVWAPALGDRDEGKDTSLMCLTRPPQPPDQPMQTTEKPETLPEAQCIFLVPVHPGSLSPWPHGSDLQLGARPSPTCLSSTGPVAQLPPTTGSDNTHPQFFIPSSLPCQRCKSGAPGS